MITFSINPNQYDIMETMVSKTNVLEIAGKNDYNAEAVSVIYLNLANPEILNKAKSKSGNLAGYIMVTAKGLELGDKNRQMKNVAIVDDYLTSNDIYVVPADKLQTPDFTTNLEFKLKNEDNHYINEFLNTREYIYIEQGNDIYRLMQLIKSYMPDNTQNDNFNNYGFLKATAKMQKLDKEYKGFREMIMRILTDEGLYSKIEKLLGAENLEEQEIKWVI